MKSNAIHRSRAVHSQRKDAKSQGLIDRCGDVESYANAVFGIGYEMLGFSVLDGDALEVESGFSLSAPLRLGVFALNGVSVADQDQVLRTQPVDSRKATPHCCQTSAEITEIVT